MWMDKLKPGVLTKPQESHTLLKTTVSSNTVCFPHEREVLSPKSAPKMPNQPKHAYLADNPDFGLNARCMKKIQMK